MSDSVVGTVKNIIALNKLPEKDRMELVTDALAGELNITNTKLIKILQDAYTTSETNHLEAKPIAEAKSAIFCAAMYKGFIVTGDADGFIRLWDPANLTKHIWDVKQNSPVTYLLVSTKGLLYAGIRGEVTVWELQTVTTLTYLRSFKFNDESKITTLFEHDRWIEVGFESGKIRSIAIASIAIIHEINVTHPVRNMILWKQDGYICTAKAIYKTNNQLVFTDSEFKDSRSLKYDWLCIRLIDGKPYAIDVRGEVYELHSSKDGCYISADKHYVSNITAFNTTIVEHINSLLYIGTTTGGLHKINLTELNKTVERICYQHESLNCIIASGNKFYFGCSCGNIHTSNL